MSDRNGYAAGVPCWVDTWQADLERAAEFYGAVFGWEEAGDAEGEVIAAGGPVVRPPFASLDGGPMSIVADPEGAVFAIWRLGDFGGAEVVNEPGAWSMSSLSTSAPGSAAAFYGAVFGWEAEAFGPATLFRLPGFVGGEPTQPVPRDVVAVIAGPYEDPMFRHMVLADPAGAVFSVSQLLAAPR